MLRKREGGDTNCSGSVQGQESAGLDAQRQVSRFPMFLQVMLDSSERSQEEGEGEGVHSTELWTAET